MEVNANIADLNGDILIKTPDRDYRLNGKATIKVDNTHGQMKKTYLINPTHEQGEELSFCYDFFAAGIHLSLSYILSTHSKNVYS